MLKSLFKAGFALMFLCNFLETSIAFEGIFNSELKSELADVVVTEEESLNEYHARSGRRSLSDRIKVEVKRKSKTHVIYLEKNPHFHTGIPISVERNGKIIFQDVKETQTVSYYHSLEPFASVMLTKAHDESIITAFGFLSTRNESFVLHRSPKTTHYLLTKMSPTNAAQQVNIDINSNVQIRERNRRAAGQNTTHIAKPVYEIELLVAVDYSCYKFWYSQAATSTNETSILKRDEEAKRLIRQYYALIMSEVDLRYRTITDRSFLMRARLLQLHVADSIDNSRWTEHPDSNGVVNATHALDLFSEWCATKQGELTEHDHAVLFSKHTLTAAGTSYVGGTCSSTKQSLCFDNFQEYVSEVAAHEIGHGLNSQHDGIQNNCSSQDGFIMTIAGNNIRDNDAHNRRLWLFSECSKDYIERFLAELNSNGTNCLIKHSHGVDIIPEYNNMLLGQIYSADVQCEHILGNGSYLVRTMYTPDLSRVCTEIRCNVPDKVGYFYATWPFEGTSCGTRKICHSGQCVDDVRFLKNGSSTQTPSSVKLTTKTVLAHGSTTSKTHSHECLDIGWPTLSCQKLSDFFSITHQHVPTVFCSNPKWASKCCAFCKAHCVDVGHGSTNCTTLSNIYMQTLKVGPEAWCPLYRGECCHFCSAFL